MMFAGLAVAAVGIFMCVSLFFRALGELLWQADKWENDR